MIALNPHTGQVLALVGGRNYGASQFDHAVQHRPTGSVFKPFVYAAAFNTSLAGTILTQPASAAGQRRSRVHDSVYRRTPHPQILLPPIRAGRAGYLPPSPC